MFQYNPEQLTRSLDPQYSDAAGAGPRRFGWSGPPRETISASIDVDVVDQLEKGEDVATSLGLFPQLSALEMLVYPKTSW